MRGRMSRGESEVMPGRDAVSWSAGGPARTPVDGVRGPPARPGAAHSTWSRPFRWCAAGRDTVVVPGAHLLWDARPATSVGVARRWADLLRIASTSPIRAEVPSITSMICSNWPSGGGPGVPGARRQPRAASRMASTCSRGTRETRRSWPFAAPPLVARPWRSRSVRNAAAPLSLS